MYENVSFVISAYSLRQLPEPEFPEIAFAGRSNVGKSSLINKLINRRNLVKVSSKPGKTQSLNYFLVEDASYYLVDLPGYGFAKVPKSVQAQWQELITGYLESRETLRCVVVILDIRHDLKDQDRDLVGWLNAHNIPVLPVYTKTDKLSKNQQYKNAKALDASLGIIPAARILFSAKTGEGVDNLRVGLDHFLS
ncbi:MAG: ribosome biogenesis GTP-binding protein YihA/YsxC [Proteobacteria bacterium]|nr:ribosome biogenesis GTP-binding protein YihA/YsxC [Pseudomonadota bacterium]MBU1709659.1 ribosome biogenesis GTP-binding protein YihA/YsxC [Pseudomonadota bacterium]